MDLIVESAPDDSEASSRVFSRMKQAGYYAYAVENDYEKARYLSTRPLSPLVFTDTMPLRQCDLLYTRKKMADVEFKNELGEASLRAGAA
jgi:hypothetical protein